MAINERTMNGYLAEAMERQAPPRYRVVAENTGQARRGSTTPGIVVSMPYDLRTIVESEYGSPAIKDATERLGYQFRDYILPMKSVIALGIPEELGGMGHAERAEALSSGDA